MNKNKTIKLDIKNGEQQFYSAFNEETKIVHNEPTLKQLSIIEEWIHKKRDKMVNRQKDQINKFKVTSDSLDVVIDGLVLSDGKQDGIIPKLKDAIRITWNKHIPNELMVVANGQFGKIKGGKIKIEWD